MITELFIFIIFCGIGATGATTVAAIVQDEAGLMLGLLTFMFWMLPSFIYGSKRRREATYSCKLCRSTELVPVDSPKGKKLLAEASQESKDL